MGDYWTPVEVGTIFESNWGYDQTNIDFYEVVKVSASGKTVVVQEIGSTSDYGGEGHNVVRPNREVRKGEPFRRKLDVWGGRANFSVASYATAFQWDGSLAYETAAGYGH